MDSFSQRMLDSIERRYETYQLSTSTTGVKMANSDDCERNELCSGEKENLTMANMQYHAFHQTVRHIVYFLFLNLVHKLA